MSSIQKKVLNGAIWMVALRFLVKSIGLVSTMVLARILVPEDFGLVALAMAVYAFLELLNQFGFDVALIQNQKATRNHYNSAWTMKVIFGLVAGLIMCLAAPWVSDFYHDERLTHIIYILALVFVVDAFENIGIVDFRKELNFNREFKFQLITKVLAVTVTISLALYFRNYWALVIGIFVGRCISLVFSYVLCSYRPGFTLVEARSLINFTKWLLATNFLAFINGRSKEIILGRIFEVKVVGLYTVAEEIASLPSTEVIAPVNRAVFPGYAKVAENKSELQELYLNVISTIALIAIPATIGLSILSPLVIPILLGKNWLEAVPIIEIIAIADCFIALNTNAAYFFTALGKPRITTFLLLIRVLVLVPLLIVFSKSFGLIGAAYSLLTVGMMMFPIYLAVISRQVGVSLLRYIGAVYRPAVAAAIMYFLIKPYVSVIDASQLDFIDLLIDALGYSLLGACVYISSVIALWVLSGMPKSIEKEILFRIYAKLNLIS